ncbi:hypothetical protein LQZ19_09115 [Treponema primitia]|uniref:class I SAM-dependent methyltransferase n=1 Tax=Treponema primitia TaxID=88058 RepID=UPI00397F62F3
MLPSPPSPEDANLQVLYDNRFKANAKSKQKIWDVLCKHFFQRFIPEESCVLDIAAGNCEFINYIKAHEKIAFDRNSDIYRYADQDVRAINDNFFNMGKYIKKNIDIIFASNLLEHLDSKEQVLAAIKLCYDYLVYGGKLLILQPNIKYVKGAYWDFIDHKIPLTEKSLIEAGQLCGFSVSYVIARFLPYTTKSRMPQHPLLVFLYLKIPFIRLLLGQQSFVVLEKQQ